MIITTPRRYLDHTNTIAFLQSSRRAAYHPNKKKHFAKILFWACSPLRRSIHTRNPYKKKSTTSNRAIYKSNHLCMDFWNLDTH
jgi:hypothetical protein